MGLLVKGVWKDEWYDTESNDGEFIRTDAQFRDVISNDEGSDFPAEAGRYHLFVSLACPWAHRTLILRELKGLSDLITVSVVKPEMLNHGWELDGDDDSHGLGSLHYLHQVYTAVKTDYSGRVTVPVLFDKKQGVIVNNESAEIIRMLNSEFNGLTGNTQDFYPKDLRSEIDKINEDVYDNINNGVYKTGFATTQCAYERNFQAVFDALDRVENLLGSRRYLAGDRITEADWRLFTTLIRFDAVYFGHFKCNWKRIEDYPNISNYLRELYQVPGIASTVNFDHIKTHYYYSHDMINPTRVIPVGPEQDFDRPHNRSTLFES